MMSHIQTISKIELLPNEILIECLKYLNGVDILYAFNQLNSRFNQLIRNIPLYLDFGDIDKPLFDDLCNKILSDEDIKQQIYSINLSRKGVYDQIKPFLTLFSFDQFPQLQSLTLTKVESYVLSQLQSILSLLYQLRSFRLVDNRMNMKELPSISSNSQIRTLEIPDIRWYTESLHQFSLLTNLTISVCWTDDVFKLLLTLKDNLKYLKVNIVCRCPIYMWAKYTSSYEDPSTNLKHLIILNFEGQYSALDAILKRTPKLTNLTICFTSQIEMTNANQFEHSITSFLPCLKIFQFVIRYSSPYDHESIEQNFQQFQSDFWCKQHQWYTQYLLSERQALIYTIPYLYTIFELKSDTKIFCNELLNNSNTFQNVIFLTIQPNTLTKKCSYRFSNITSMILEATSCSMDKPILTRENMEALKMIVNLSNLKELDISDFQLETPSVLLELLKKASQISTLSIHSHVLQPLFGNDELCQYLNKMIINLEVIENSRCAMDDSCDIEKFCQTFSNLQQLTCQFDQLDAFLFILKHLPKLTCVNVFSSRFTCGSTDWLDELNLDGKTINDVCRSGSKHLIIWFNKNNS